MNNEIEKSVIGNTIHIAIDFDEDITDGVIALTTDDAVSVIKLNERPSKYGPITTYESMWRGPIRHFAISCQTGLMALNQEYQDEQQIGAFNEEFMDEPHIILACTSNCIKSPRIFEQMITEAFIVSNSFKSWVVDINTQLLALMKEDFALIGYFNGSWDDFRNYYLHFRPNGECYNIHYLDAEPYV